MDSIQYLLKFLFKLVVVLVFVIIVWWGIATFAPSFSIRSLLSFGTATSTANGGWLPSPRTFKGLFNNPKTPTGEDNVYVPGKEYNGYGNVYNGGQGNSQVDFVIYTSTGTQIIHAVGSSGSTGQQGATGDQSSKQNGYSQKEFFIKNLSIFQGGHIYTGISFTGEARDTMFQNAKFPIIIADTTGRPVSISYAEPVANASTPGWIVFRVRINDVLPNKVPCTMVFEQGKTTNQYTYTNVNTPLVRVAIPIVCN